MKLKKIIYIAVISVTTLTTVSACKDNKKNVESNEVSALLYSCPMNCEDGKSYHEAGSCPVCKMDLMLTDKEISATCQVHLDGKCKCEGDTCACASCEEHSKKMTCTIGEDGKCTDKNCKKHQKNKDCVMNEDGKCVCESGKCTCVDCASKTNKV
ncbi:heavy metal-binding domain-containing protein [Cellulophaga sp. Ld12]|uniref:heavy metal-binding domain-containing protein n=1 Tax=Cellulophaga sp. Ld12 TaxID=3229535 RepID=UPI00386E4323